MNRDTRDKAGQSGTRQATDGAGHKRGHTPPKGGYVPVCPARPVGQDMEIGQMGAGQRAKGQRGERELFALLSDQLGVVVRRNVDQARAGGADGLDVPGWAVEVKRQQAARVTQWWKQAVEQANMLERRPVLFYRANYKPWRAMMLLCDIAPENFYGKAAQTELVELSLEAACLVIRESLP